MEITTDRLREIEKPGRYLAPFIPLRDRGELSSDRKVLIVFPDLFEVAQSHMGIKIIYELFTERGILADFAFGFRPDMEKVLREKGGMESLLYGIDVREFDLICVSFQYQLQFPTFLRMLDVAGIKRHAAERGDDSPLIIAGGPVMTNPEITRKFVDFTFIGEIEPIFGQLCDALYEENRDGRKSRMEQIAGFYPSLSEPSEKARRVVVADLDTEGVNPTHTPVFGMRTVHDRFVVEIQRGCTRGCRFCMAGSFYRPHRERSAGEVASILDSSVIPSGCTDAGFLSLSAGDHSQIEELLDNALGAGRREFSVGLPSLRTETLSEDIVKLIGRGRKGGFTLAPESGSERLRRVINKGNTDEDLIDAVHKIFRHGWQHIKLYFMLGLPTETEEDLNLTTQLIKKICGIARNYGRRNSVTASFSTFVPQPFTPFQWERMADIDEIREKQSVLRQNLRGMKNLKLDWHDRFVSNVEGMLSRSGSEMSPVIEYISDHMQDLQTWSEGFSYEMWLEAMEQAGVDPKAQIAERDPEVPLPFESIDLGITREFLLRERENAYNMETTGDCAVDGKCRACGVCDMKKVKPVLGKEKAQTAPESVKSEPEDDFNRGNAYPFLFRFTKRDRARSVGHLDTVAFMIKGFLMAEMPILYSEGFHPMPRLSLIDALPVGVASEEEAGIVWLKEDMGEKETVEKLNNLFQTCGITFTSFEMVKREGAKTFEKKLRKLEAINYRIDFEDEKSCQDFAASYEGETSRDGKTVHLAYDPAKGSLLKKMEGFHGYDVTKLPSIPNELVDEYRA